MNSNVAPPSSLLRKNTGKNLSMGSATRTSLLGSRNILDAITGSTGAKRRSLLSTPASTNKRRQSLSGSALHPPSSSSSQQTPQMGFSERNGANGGAAPAIPSSQLTPSQSVPIDQRPLRDKNYQQLIQQEIYDFLVTNRFELDMNHTITLKTLKQPTQKDFILIFKFLYNKIDPYYEFHKSIEVEVFSLLKILNYPYLDSINRSQISAVGGQNWPSFLGILYWMIKLNLSISNLNIDDTFISPDDDFDKIFIKYIRDSYQAFINEQDDYSEFYEEMKIDFEKLNSTLLQDIKNLESDNDRLRKQYDEVNNQLLELQNAEKKSVALEDDLIKFKAYIETMENRKSKWSEIIDKIKEEINNRDDELKGLNASQRDLESQILQKGITISDINNLNIERDKLSKAIDLTSVRLEEAQSKLNDMDIEFIKNYQSLENFIKQYNNLISKIKSPNYDFEIKLSPTATYLIGQDASNPEKYVSLKPSDLINKVLKDEKIELLKFRSEINTKIHQYQDEQIKLQEQCDLVIEKNTEQSEYLEGLGSKLTASKMNYDEIYETMINDSTTYSTQIEKLERELRSIKINTNQGFIELENQYQNTMIEHDELTHSLSKSRKALFDKCCKMAEFIMNFKLSIQTNLLDLDDLAMNEYEKEQKEGEPNPS